MAFTPISSINTCISSFHMHHIHFQTTITSNAMHSHAFPARKHLCRGIHSHFHALTCLSSFPPSFPPHNHQKSTQCRGLHSHFQHTHAIPTSKTVNAVGSLCFPAFLAVFHHISAHACLNKQPFAPPFLL